MANDSPYTHTDLRVGKLKLHLKAFVALKINLELSYIRQKRKNCILTVFMAKQNWNSIFLMKICVKKELYKVIHFCNQNKDNIVCKYGFRL